MTLLSDLAVGQSGQVVRVLGNDALSLRLMEMGIIPGTKIEIVGSALLGDPVELQVQGYRLSVRRGEAERIEVNQGE